MRILLDENVPRRLKSAFGSHAVATVAEMGWSGIQNGALLKLAEPMFDVLVTTDKGIQHQNNLTKTTLILVTLVAMRNKLSFLLPLVPEALAKIVVAKPNEVINVFPPNP